MHRFSKIKFRYNIEKNASLLAEREIGFDEIANAMIAGNIISIAEHHNKEKYPNQKIAYVLVLEKVYVVPYVEEDDGYIFLKTAYPSSKARNILFPNKNKNSQT